METAAIQVERHPNGGCTVRATGLVTGSLVADLRHISQEFRSTRLDLRPAWLSTDGVHALRDWHRSAQGALELVLPDTIATLVMPEAANAGSPDHAAPVDLPALLAHEVRGPLSVAHLRLQTLAARLGARGLGDEAATCHSAIAGLDAVSRLFDTYLTASRAWTLRPVDLGAVCAAAAQDARELLGRGKVEVRVEPPDAPVWVSGERQALHQLVWNLVRNGLEASTAEPEVRVDLRAPAGHPQVELVVSDRGPGFPAEILEAPFTTRRSQKAGGMGIGLVLCKWISDRHHAQLRLVNSQRGAQARLLLPRAAAPA